MQHVTTRTRDFTIWHLGEEYSLHTRGFIAHPDFHYISHARENILVRKRKTRYPV